MRLLLFGLCLGGCATDKPPQAATTVVRFTTGTPGGGFQPLGEALARAYRRALPSVIVEVQEGGGSVGNVEAVQRGNADLGFAFADVTYTAFAAPSSEKNEPFDRLRGIAVLQLTPLHLVAGAQSGINSVADLHGRRVGVGPPGSGTALTANLVMKAYHVDPASVRIEATSFSEMADRLLAGKLDALFVAGSGPLESVAAMTRTGARVIPIAGPLVEALRQEHPFLRRTVIAAGTYTDHQVAIETIGIDNVLVCSAELEEETVYKLTKALFEVLPDLAVEHRSLRLIDLEQASATPIPLHDGAARYYREREITQ